MIASELSLQIQSTLGFPPTAEQLAAIDMFARFATDYDERAVMVLSGSAGTGKTTVAGAIVRTLTQLGQKVMLLAPTGRAAKVFSLHSGHAAFTIHRKIYRQKAFTGDMSGFLLNDNLYRDTFFIVDEASMVSNNQGGEASFGSGRLLDDLVHFVYAGTNCRLMLIGDQAQLPPVGELESPALQPDFLAGYGLRPYHNVMNEVLRQSQQSGILYNATVVRQMITHDEATALPVIQFHGFADICMVPGDELIERRSEESK